MQELVYCARDTAMYMGAHRHGHEGTLALR